MGLHHTFSAVAWRCSMGPANHRVTPVPLRSVPTSLNQLFGRSNPLLPFQSFGHRPLWNSASSLSQATISRRQPRIVRYLNQYEGPKEQDQVLKKITQRKRDAKIKRLAARLYAAFRTRIPSETRKVFKSRRVSPSNNAIPRPPDSYYWMAKIVQDCQDTFHVVYVSRKILLGFILVFAIYVVMSAIEINYNFANYSQEKPNTKIAHWLRSFSKASWPAYPNDNDPLMMHELTGQRSCDWLQSPVSLIAQFTNGFACLVPSSLWRDSLLILALIPLLRQVLSSKQIVVAYIAGGFLSANIQGAIAHFTNPMAKLPAADLQYLLNNIPPPMFDREFRLMLLESKMKDLHEMEEEATKMIGSAPKAEIQKIMANIQDKKQKIENLTELEPAFEYTGLCLGTSCATNCMSQCTVTHR